MISLGREGGDATDADVVLVAVPSGSISEALTILKISPIFYRFAFPGEL